MFSSFFLVYIPCLPLFFPKHRIASTDSRAHVYAHARALFVIVFYCPIHTDHL